MRNYILCFALLFTFLSCRSKEVIEPTVADNGFLLKNLTVKGASEVKIDHEKGIIQVTLPESYFANSIVLEFTVNKNAFLNYYDTQKQQILVSNISNPEKLSLNFTYEGSAPLNIELYEKQVMGKQYVLYVIHTTNKLQAQLTSVDSVSYSLNANFHFNIISSSGTVPNKSDTKLPYVLLKRVGSINADTSVIYRGYDTYFGGFKLDKYSPFENELFKIELVANGLTTVLNDNFRFLRKKAVVEVYYGGLLAVIGKSFDLKGGIFTASNKYAVKLSNDYMNGTIELKTQVKDANTLSVEINPTVKPEGYLVDIYENEILFYHGVINVGNGGLISAIRNFIKIDKFPFATTPPERTSTNKEYFTKGDSLLILPVDAVFFGNSRPITSEELEIKMAPKLQLKILSKEITLNPIKKVYGWAIAGASVLYFQYTIPKSTESGFYEAQLIYPDGRESLKYWNKIEIK